MSLSATEREQRALATLTQTRTRLQDLAARHAAISAELASLDAEESAAEERAAAARAHAAAQPEQVQAARARLMVMASSVAEAGARAHVLHTEEALQEAHTAAEAATAAAATAHAEAVIARERLDGERVAIEGEQQTLQGLLAHLAHEVEESRTARGEEILSAALEKARLLEKIAGAREQLRIQASDALATYCQQVRAELREYPAALEATRGTLLEAPRPPTQVEALLSAYITLMETIEHAAAQRLEPLEVGGLWQVLVSPEPQVIIGALQGYNSFAQGKRHAAETYLANYRERLQLTQQQ